jgi:RNA polymerase sigma-70 factor (ECF subfamily)
LSYLNELDRHINEFVRADESVSSSALQKANPVEYTVMQAFQAVALRNAIAALPEKQRRRVYLHYFAEMEYARIAEIEGCTFQAVSNAVKTAIMNLKKYFHNGG